jgi:hypothetical protein
VLWSQVPYSRGIYLVRGLCSRCLCLQGRAGATEGGLTTATVDGFPILATLADSETYNGGGVQSGPVPPMTSACQNRVTCLQNDLLLLRALVWLEQQTQECCLLHKDKPSALAARCSRVNVTIHTLYSPPITASAHPGSGPLCSALRIRCQADRPAAYKQPGRQPISLNGSPYNHQRSAEAAPSESVWQSAHGSIAVAGLQHPKLVPGTLSLSYSLSQRDPAYSPCATPTSIAANLASTLPQLLVP